MSSSPDLKTHQPSLLWGWRDPAHWLEGALPHQRAILVILASADRFGIESGPLLRGLARELPHRYRRPVEVLASRIDEGLDPLDAITGQWEPDPPADHELPLIRVAVAADVPKAFDPRLLPPLLVQGLQLARTGGTWPEFSDSLLARDPVTPSRNLEEQGRWFRKQIQLFSQLMVILSVLTFFHLSIMPSLVMMMREFAVDLPYPARLLVQLKGLTLLLPGAFLILFLLSAGFGLIRLQDWVRRFSPFSWQRVDLPDPVLRRRALALVPRQQSLGSCRPENGFPGLPDPVPGREGKALAMAHSPETRAWLLDWMAGKALDQTEKRSAVWVRSMIFAVQMVMTGLVFLAGWSIFSLLISLMNELIKW